MGLRARTAVVIRDDVERELPVEDVLVGDIVVVRPGEKVPVDGRVVDGDSYVDTSMITGEPTSEHKGEGDDLIGGTINDNSVLKMRPEFAAMAMAVSSVIVITLSLMLKRYVPPVRRKR